MKTNESTTPVKQKDLAQTPPWFIKSLESFLGINFKHDVCANAATAKTESYFSLDEKGQDALVLEWPDHSWVNPPFSGKNINNFINQCIAQVELNNISVAMIMPANIETAYARAATEHCDTLIKMPFRLEYLRPDGTRFCGKSGKAQGPEFASMVAWFTPLGLKAPTREIYHDFRIGFKDVK